MVKLKRKARTIKPIGRSPVISVRVPESIYDRIVAGARDNKRSMSEEILAHLIRDFDLADMMKAGIIAANFRAAGFQPLYDGTSSPRWVKLPEGTQGAGFKSEEQAKTFIPTKAPESAALTEADINAQLDQINAVLDDLGDQIRALRAQHKQKETT
jgi:hypothetical protein